MSTHHPRPNKAVAAETGAVSDRTFTRHGGHGAHLLMCLAMISVIGALVVAGSIASLTGLLWVAACVAMIAAMWLFMKAFDH